MAIHKHIDLSVTVYWAKEYHSGPLVFVVMVLAMEIKEWTLLQCKSVQSKCFLRFLQAVFIFEKTNKKPFSVIGPWKCQQAGMKDMHSINGTEDWTEQNPRDVSLPQRRKQATLSLKWLNRLPQGENYVGINRWTMRYSTVQTTVKNPQII